MQANMRQRREGSDGLRAKQTENICGLTLSIAKSPDEEEEEERKQTERWIQTIDRKKKKEDHDEEERERQQPLSSTISLFSFRKEREQQ